MEPRSLQPVQRRLRSFSWCLLSLFFSQSVLLSIVITGQSEISNMSLSDLPALNAALNTTSFILLSTGYYFIRRKRISAHRTCMIGALVASALFLTSYLIYHYNHPTTMFAGTGWIRTLYFVILFSHVVLAVVILPLVLVTVTRALRRNYQSHARIARITFPLWLYVSVTGVVVYLMLYRM